MEAFRFADAAADYERILKHVSEHLVVDATLPEWPFTKSAGYVHIFEWDIALWPDMGMMLDLLAARYEDVTVDVAMLQHNYRDAWEELCHFPAFQVGPQYAPAHYADALHCELFDGSPDTMHMVSNFLGIVGSSGRWAVWAERDWELALLLTPDAAGPWLDSGVPFFDLNDFDLAEYVSVGGWRPPPPQEQLDEFWRNVRERGSGPR